MSVTTGYTVPTTSNQALFRHKQLVWKEDSIRKMQEKRLRIPHPLHDRSSDQLAQARSVYGVRLRPIPQMLRTYDRIHTLPSDWDPKVKKDEYRHLVAYGTNARLDERNREIPIMFNSEFGHRIRAPPEPFKRDNARVKTFHGSIYRTNGVMMIDRPKAY